LGRKDVRNKVLSSGSCPDSARWALNRCYFESRVGEINKLKSAKRKKACTGLQTNIQVSDRATLAAWCAATL